jgi:hypothetical protein
MEGNVGGGNYGGEGRSSTRESVTHVIVDEPSGRKRLCLRMLQ